MENATLKTQRDASTTFVQLAKSSKGRACSELIKNALAKKNIFFYGELLSMPNVQALKDTEFSDVLNLLKHFSSGTWQSYHQRIAAGERLPQLNEGMKRKLRLLTLISLSSGVRNKNKNILSFDFLKQQLGLEEEEATTTTLEEKSLESKEGPSSSNSDLVHLLIECIYAGVIKGKIDERSQTFIVQYSIGRDVTVKNQNLSGQLKRWLDAALTLDRELTERKTQTSKAMSGAKDKRLLTAAAVLRSKDAASDSASNKNKKHNKRHLRQSGFDSYSSVGATHSLLQSDGYYGLNASMDSSSAVSGSGASS